MSLGNDRLEASQWEEESGSKRVQGTRKQPRMLGRGNCGNCGNGREPTTNQMNQDETLGASQWDEQRGSKRVKGTRKRTGMLGRGNCGNCGNGR